jgi:hypothetical protein
MFYDVAVFLTYLTSIAKWIARVTGIDPQKSTMYSETLYANGCKTVADIQGMIKETILHSFVATELDMLLHPPPPTPPYRSVRRRFEPNGEGHRTKIWSC